MGFPFDDVFDHGIVRVCNLRTMFARNTDVTYCKKYNIFTMKVYDKG